MSTEGRGGGGGGGGALVLNLIFSEGTLSNGRDSLLTVNYLTTTKTCTRTVYWNCIFSHCMDISIHSFNICLIKLKEKRSVTEGTIIWYKKIILHNIKL